MDSDGKYDVYDNGSGEVDDESDGNDYKVILFRSKVMTEEVLR